MSAALGGDVLREEPLQQTSRSVETTVHVFETWKAELGAAGFHGLEGSHCIKSVFRRQW